MKFISHLFFLFLLTGSGHLISGEVVASGDIIFHRSLSRQSYAIAAATKSQYTHMGIILIEKGRPYVYEAVQPVRKTPLAEWIRRGKDGKFVVKRLRDSSKLDVPKMKRALDGLAGKSYDWLFDWSDNRIYCSELVWKAYQRGCGIELARLKKLKDFDLNHRLVKPVVKERYGSKIPLDMKVIAPSDIYSSKLLKTVEIANK